MNDIHDAANQQPAPPPLTPAPAEPRYKGVGGWLLLFCLLLTVIGPLVLLVSLAAGYSESSKNFEQFIFTLLTLGLMGFGVYAGTGLWSIRAGAVGMAKLYLLCYLGSIAVASILNAKVEVQGVLSFVVWYSYLKKSKRVRATYES